MTDLAPTAASRLEIAVEAGRRAGERIAVGAGTFLIGTGRGCAVCLRDGGVGFKHAALHLGPDGRGELEDLGARGGTLLDDEPLPVGGRVPIAPGARVQVGEARLLLVVRPVELPDVEPAELIPAALREEVASTLLELGAALDPARSTPLAAALGEASPTERLHIEPEAIEMAASAVSLLRSELLPGDPTAWLRFDSEERITRVHRKGEDGLVLAMQCWDVIARLSRPSARTGPDVVPDALSRLLLFEGRLFPTAVQEAAPGWWRCEYEATTQPLLGRFDRLEAWSDGQVLLASLVPWVAWNGARAGGAAEDPVTELLREQSSRTVYRPLPGSLVKGNPMPPGGRNRPRPKPQRRG